MNWRDRITLDAAMLAGKPVVRGSRLAVDFIVGLLEVLAPSLKDARVLLTFDKDFGELAWRSGFIAKQRSRIFGSRRWVFFRPELHKRTLFVRLEIAGCGF
jgi:hypothetical protein